MMITLAARLLLAGRVVVAEMSSVAYRSWMTGYPEVETGRNPLPTFRRT